MDWTLFFEIMFRNVSIVVFIYFVFLTSRNLFFKNEFKTYFNGKYLRKYFEFTLLFIFLVLVVVNLITKVFLV